MLPADFHKKSIFIFKNYTPGGGVIFIHNTKWSTLELW